MTSLQFKGRVFAENYHFKTDWATFVPAMRDKVMRFEVVDESEWEQRLNAMFA